MSRETRLDKSSKFYIRHCRFGHIKKTRITKLQGYFDPYDCESFETCESCLL